MLAPVLSVLITSVEKTLAVITAEVLLALNQNPMTIKEKARDLQQQTHR